MKKGFNAVAVAAAAANAGKNKIERMQQAVNIFTLFDRCRSQTVKNKKIAKSVHSVLTSS